MSSDDLLLQKAESTASHITACTPTMCPWIHSHANNNGNNAYFIFENWLYLDSNIMEAKAPL